MRARNRRAGKKRKRSKNKEFMDAALDAYIRDQALHKWHELQDLLENERLELPAALDAGAEFFEKGAYREIWQQQWRGAVSQGADQQVSGALFECIEKAVRSAVMEEREARQRTEDSLLEDTASYQDFISRALGKLLEESGGEIEDTL